MNCLTIVIASLLSLNPSWTEVRATKWATPICEESLKRDIDPRIVVSIIKHESNFRIQKVWKNSNGSTDYGSMQFNCNKDHDKIFLKWRKYRCDPRRIKKLLTLRGGIEAGTKILSFWKEVEESKNGDRFFLFSIKRSNILQYIRNIDNILSLIDLSVCRDCSLVALSLNIYKNPGSYWVLKDVLKRRWWVKRYNWHSKNHWLRVLFIYKALLEREEAIYPLIRTDFYRTLKTKELRECLKSSEYCIRRFRKWRRNRNLKSKLKN